MNACVYDVCVSVYNHNHNHIGVVNQTYCYEENVILQLLVPPGRCLRVGKGLKRGTQEFIGNAEEGGGNRALRAAVERLHFGLHILVKLHWAPQLLDSESKCNPVYMHYAVKSKQNDRFTLHRGSESDVGSTFAKCVIVSTLDYLDRLLTLLTHIRRLWSTQLCDLCKF
nr:hypothetical protein Iba_chr03dCG6350 [Ipomoea batatas]